MKKFVVIFLTAYCFIASVAFAESPPKFYNNDKNYPLIYPHNGMPRYLDKNSIKVEVSDPPYYIIKASTITVVNPKHYKFEGNGISSQEYTFFYDEDEVDMRCYDTNNVESYHNWLYLRPHYIVDSGNAITGVGIPACVGEASFYISQGRKFYGNYLWKNFHRTYGAYVDIFNDKFYEILR